MTILLTKKQPSYSFVILGASGLVGRAIIRQIVPDIKIKAVARNIPLDVHDSPVNVTWYCADILHLDSLTQIVEEGDVVINLAYDKSGRDKVNIDMMNNIIDICFQKQARRLVHCSTAMVIGDVDQSVVDETTICSPVSIYEKDKYALEQIVDSAVKRGLDATILRPTAIIGPGGKNLLKLADSLTNGNRFVNYIRASLFYKRKMHLVPVENVAIAILHLALQKQQHTNNIYIISSDDDPKNNYRSVEKILLESLKLPPRRVPVFPMPLFVLSRILKLMGRSNWNLNREFCANKIQGTHLKVFVSVNEAVNAFGADIRQRIRD